MRILMLDNEYPPLGGGMGTVNQEVVRVFARHTDLEIDLITSAIGGRPETERIAERIIMHKVPVWNRNIHHSTNRELLLYAAQSLPLAYMHHLRRPYDLCLAWSALPAGAAALALRRLSGIPFVVWVSGPDIPGFEQRYEWLYPLLTPTIRAVWRGAASVIAKCAEEIAMIQVVDPAIEPVLIPNGVDLDVFRPSRTKAGEEPLKVICVARLIERKGQHHLIEAIRRLAVDGVMVTAELVGTGDSQHDLEVQARAAGVADRVIFSGYVPREQIAERYAMADVFVLPSYNEGLSLAALEALAAGLPLVVTRTGGTNDLVHEETNGLTFNWGDSATLATHLRRLAEDRALVQRMGEESRKRAYRFGWEAIAEQFLQTLESVPMHHLNRTRQRVRNDPLRIRRDLQGSSHE
ncbi:MAG: glycosyltransferase family 4 protein [Chloroflexi bacterium]|nr:glycosyltransferase family 4 protein [Chloroflexota bacterium]